MAVRLVCYLGTRGCPGVLEEAMRDHFDPVAIGVPVEPRLLGPSLQGDLEEELASVAEILAEEAHDRAVRIAERDEQELLDVFDSASDPSQRIRSRVIGPPIEESLVDHAEAIGADRCFLSRDALDILDDVGIRVARAIEPEGLELRTR